MVANPRKAPTSSQTFVSLKDEDELVEYSAMLVWHGSSKGFCWSVCLRPQKEMHAHSVGCFVMKCYYYHYCCCYCYSYYYYYYYYYTTTATYYCYYYYYYYYYCTTTTIATTRIISFFFGKYNTWLWLPKPNQQVLVIESAVLVAESALFVTES